MFLFVGRNVGNALEMIWGEVSAEGWAGLALCIGFSEHIVSPLAGMSSVLIYISLSLSAALFQACRYHPWVSQWPSKSIFYSWSISKIHL